MAFSQDALKTARDSGYSDDEIYSHLAETDPRFDQAKQAGYSLDEVANHLSSPAAQSSPDSTTPVASPPYSDDARMAELGWRQRELAEGIGVAESQVSRWLSGKRVPSLLDAFRIERSVLGIPAEVWVSRT